MLKQPMYLLDKAVVLFLYNIFMNPEELVETPVVETEEVTEEVAEEETA